MNFYLKIFIYFCIAIALISATPHMFGDDIQIDGTQTWHGQKYITTAGTVDISTGGQGVRVKVDAAGITWSSLNLNGVTLTNESLVITNTGTYLVSWEVGFDGTNGKNYLFEIITDTNNDPSDGITDDNDPCHLDLDVQANTHMNSAGSCIISVAASAYVYLSVIEPGGGAGTDFDIDHGGVTISQL
jgi:hypothetical protein